MRQLVVEASYPLYFREDATKKLADLLKRRQSVELVGMKRVGINNFLRFFLFNKQVHKKYLLEKQNDVFILVDLNDLIERELFPFWRLTLKRIADAVEESTVSESLKKKIAQLFITSLQTSDSFLTYDAVREAFVELSQECNPTLFFTRFDRLQDVVTPEFFNNLESMREATHQKLAYVFTGFRELDTMAPDVFAKKSFYGFSQVMYMHPATYQDVDVMLLAFLEQYDMKLTKQFIQTIIDLSGGHAQYLHLLLVILDELHREKHIITPEEFTRVVKQDERAMLLSEEVWDNLTSEEQDILQKVVNKEKITPTDKEEGRYIWDTGIVTTEGKVNELFTPLFEEFLVKKGQARDSGTVDLSKKEHILFSLLKQYENTICEREKIVEEVWPEYQQYGVSDWSIDRLVARLRGKLKKQKSPYEIITIRTRGYKLVTE